VDVKISESHEAMSYHAASQVAAYVRARESALICFAGGDTPLRTYQILIEMQKKGRVNLKDSYYVSLDEWVGLGYADKGSCQQMMRDGFYSPAGISESHICLFDGLSGDMSEECEKVEAFIRRFGGIGLAILGIGMNGHIGFNEPNGSDREGCFVIELHEVTKRVGQKYFPNGVPLSKGITIGYKTLEKADEVIYVAGGEKKNEIVKLILNSQPNPEVPATMLKNHHNICFYLSGMSFI
jgi:glucosamine-6-phosphate isomerase